MRALLRQPALHFFAIGGLLFAGQTLLGAPGAATPDTVVLPAERTLALRAGWRARTGGAPDEAQMAALVRGELDDQLWIAEARRLGVHESDPVVRSRLVRNMRFVGDGQGSDEELFEQALALGMDRRDPVVRRRLVEVMKLGVAAAARAQEPSEQELRAYLEAHRERFAQPARVGLSQIYLSRDRRGDHLEADARALLAALRAEGAGPEQAARRGDPFLLPAELPARSDAELARELGAAFPAALADLPSGAWAGPVPSAYGLHLVWIRERIAGSDPPLDAVRAAVRESLQSERAERATRQALRELRAER